MDYQCSWALFMVKAENIYWKTVKILETIEAELAH